MCESSGQDLMHGRIVVRSGYGTQFEFTVIAALRLAFLVDYHGAYGLETVDIGNIVGLHP